MLKNGNCSTYNALPLQSRQRRWAALSHTRQQFSLPCFGLPSSCRPSRPQPRTAQAGSAYCVRSPKSSIASASPFQDALVFLQRSLPSASVLRTTSTSATACAQDSSTSAPAARTRRADHAPKANESKPAAVRFCTRWPFRYELQPHVSLRHTNDQPQSSPTSFGDYWHSPVCVEKVGRNMFTIQLDTSSPRRRFAVGLPHHQPLISLQLLCCM